MGVAVFPAASAGFDPTKAVLQQTFNTSSNNVSFPAGVTQVYALVVGAGGSGGTLGQSQAGSGGGGAGAAIWGTTPTSSKVIVGAGGAGLVGATNTQNSQMGNRGGSSSFGIISAPGGGAGMGGDLIGGSGTSPLTTWRGYGTNGAGFGGGIQSGWNTTNGQPGPLVVSLAYTGGGGWKQFGASSLFDAVSGGGGFSQGTANGTSKDGQDGVAIGGGGGGGGGFTDTWVAPGVGGNGRGGTGGAAGAASTGNTVGGGGGGGGAGWTNAGSAGTNPSGSTGGNGGAGGTPGGGGGGAGSGAGGVGNAIGGNSGAGGNGAVYLYY